MVAKCLVNMLIVSALAAKRCLGHASQAEDLEQPQILRVSQNRGCTKRGPKILVYIYIYIIYIYIYIYIYVFVRLMVALRLVCIWCGTRWRENASVACLAVCLWRQLGCVWGVGWVCLRHQLGVFATAVGCVFPDLKYLCHQETYTSS